MTYETARVSVSRTSLQLAPSPAFPSADEAGEGGFLTLRDILEDCRRPRIRRRAHGGDPPSKVKARIINALRTAQGAVLSCADLIEAAYGDDAEGGPDTAVKCIHVVIFRLRKAGFPIEWLGYGYRYVSTQHEVIA